MIERSKRLLFTLSLCLLLTSCFSKDNETVRTNIKVVTDEEIITDLKVDSNTRISKQMIEEDFENLMKTNSGFYYCKHKKHCIFVSGRKPILDSANQKRPLLAIAPVELYDFKNHEMYFGEAQIIDLFDEDKYKLDFHDTFVINDNVVKGFRYDDRIYRPVYVDKKYVEYDVKKQMYENNWIEYGDYIPIQQRLRTSETYTKEFEQLMKPIFFEKYLKFEELRSKNEITDEIQQEIEEYQNNQEV